MGIFKKEEKGTIDPSRKAVLWMHPDALLKFMTSNRWVITEGHLPEDTQFHHVYYDSRRMVFGLVCSSNNFKEVKLGEELPELPPVTFRWWNQGDGEIPE